jgi:hypothetical protein
MIPSVRNQFNASFSETKYQRFLQDIASQHNHLPPFRISESPVFVESELKKKIFCACEEITDVIMSKDFMDKTEQFLFEMFRTPNEGRHNLFLQYDFGICELPDGSLVPKLIELQGFPTLYFYQDMVANMYRKHFDLPDNFSHLFGGLTSESYQELLKRIIIGDCDPKNVILLEIEPDKQPTRIDYICTAHALGLKVLCISQLKKSGRNLYYLDDLGKKIEVHRIYNRVIFDELIGRKDLEREFYFKDEVDVDWIGHPNWFFRISKSTMPLLSGQYVPKTTILSEIDNIPLDLENYVLKPLYSFSGSGVVFNVTQEDLDAVKDLDGYVLQEKVTYSPIIQSPEGKVKCEIRMLLLWESPENRPYVVNNLARMSRGEMIGVKYNRDKTWVGGSVGFFERT